MSFWTRRNWLTLAALAGLVSVGFGAFGAHGAHDPKAQEWLRTGALYGFVHVLATYAAGWLSSQGARRAALAAGFFLAGVILFSGSLWAMALGAPSLMGIVTPFGGLSFIAGWALLAWSAFSASR